MLEWSRKINSMSTICRSSSNAKTMIFKIATIEGVKEVEGEPIEILGHKCFIWKRLRMVTLFYSYVFSVTEIKSGMTAGDDYQMDAAIERAKDNFRSTNILEMEKSNRAKLRHAGIEFPVNS